MDKIDIEDTAPRIRSNFKPADDALIQGQKRKQWRRERRLKRIITVAMGYLTMAWMFYLIMVTKTTAPKIWDPHSILGISRVTKQELAFAAGILINSSHQARHRLRNDTGIFRGSITRIKP